MTQATLADVLRDYVLPSTPRTRQLGIVDEVALGIA